METKKCSKCQIVKPVGEFHKAAHGRLGVRSKCKTCSREARKQYYHSEDQRTRRQQQRELSNTIFKKVCKVCGEELLSTDFSVNSNSRDGRTSSCKNCRNESYKIDYHSTAAVSKRESNSKASRTIKTKVCANCFVELPARFFSTRSREKDGLNPSCRACCQNARRARTQALQVNVQAIYDRVESGSLNEVAQCVDCNKVKSLKEFTKDHRNLSGYTKRCKSCTNAEASQRARSKYVSKRIVPTQDTGPDATRICQRCNRQLPLHENFNKARNRRDGYQAWCKACKQEHASHPEIKARRNELARGRHAANPEKERNRRAKRQADNPEALRASRKRWYDKNPQKINALAARGRAERERANILRTAEHEAEIEAVYREARELSEATGIQHDVDHIVPLKGRPRGSWGWAICGLHVIHNLQILPAKQNYEKHSTFTTEWEAEGWYTDEFLSELEQLRNPQRKKKSG